ncbi:stage III sporulation protein AH [Anoxybacillus pushchinoensis]|uniref:Stage III sporulation protein AH n=1 Tax=Anoxybacillus pushchinoensis TaxID=150248 RepID=A0A1I0SQS3_9BACL|nr:SpoIIIAH-like family protein [Anoxybacillus pushchinoensis]SFA41851.1 stage III sporulation protein AH [Anoxybacillus pushchinoensis]
MLKKQTVWLLTMFSLVVVLSVYYVTSPQLTEQVAFEQKSEETDLKPTDEAMKGETDLKPTDEAMKGETATEAEITVEQSNIASDDLFTALRLEIEDERSKLRQDLNAIVASNNVSAEEKSKAIDQLQQLSNVAEKEAVLETLIKSKGYDDALVRVHENQVHITVKAKEHSKKAANEIIQLVQSELGRVQDVAVRFQK